MNGPEHYRKAEQLLIEASTSYADETALIAQAQVHATLALAAAQAWPIVDRYKGDSLLTNDWSDVIGWVLPAEVVEDEA